MWIETVSLDYLYFRIQTCITSSREPCLTPQQFASIVPLTLECIIQVPCLLPMGLCALQMY